jgi:hypothetical protein
MAMPIDEQELRSRLAETAALAGPPRCTADDLATSVRRARRRRRRAGIITVAVVAVAAAAVAIPLTRGGTSQPSMNEPAPPPPWLSYTVTANGQTRSVPATGGEQPLFTVTPGERLTVTVQVRVPGPQAMTALWLGITNGVLSGHASMEPVLAASTRGPLRPGLHRFVLHWAVPVGLRPGASRQLSAQWAWPGPEPGNAEREVAVFAVPSRATSPAAVAGRLRAMALHAVAVCGGGPAWIRAVRTTYGQATALAGGGGQTAESATAAVYLVVMKGDFILANGGPVPSCAHAPEGHYFSAIVDAVTFTTLEAGLGNRPPSAALQTLGPVLNLTQVRSPPRRP